MKRQLVPYGISTGTQLARAVSIKSMETQRLVQGPSASVNGGGELVLSGYIIASLVTNAVS